LIYSAHLGGIWRDKTKTSALIAEVWNEQQVIIYI